MKKINHRKKLSNPFSTGSGGAHFEAHVQSSFVVLMLTGGHVPCLPCWPIKEIKLQGKIDGFDTDDLIVVIENPESKEQWKLLGQIKHSIAITKDNPLLGEVIQAAWNDFKNPEVFIRGKDKIALITSSINTTDEHNVKWLLDQARHTNNSEEYFRRVQQANFSPSLSNKKLQAIEYHLINANNGNEISREELYLFLKNFYLLSYDLGKEYGVVLSLLHSHISQFCQQYPERIWSRIVDIVMTWNHDAGIITYGNLPDDLIEAFSEKAISEVKEKQKIYKEFTTTDLSNQSDAFYLALAILIGSWEEGNKFDQDAVSRIFGISYQEWLKKASEMLCLPNSPLSLKNGIWRINNRLKLWKLLGSRILDQNLDTFMLVSLIILKEPDPAFDLPSDERYAANIYGKDFKYSFSIRKGIAEGLALLGAHSFNCCNCTYQKVESVTILIVRELLTTANWILWGSLDSLLPLLAEAAPNEFLDVVEKAILVKPRIFDELYSQENNSIFGRNYLTGLLWALEAIAWDEQFFVRAIIILGELAKRDPGGNWTNRPINSLKTIFLPWFPQTFASINKRKIAMETLLRESPEITWNLILQLLPNQKQISIGSHKPIWRKTIPTDLKNPITKQEYLDQVSFYADLAVRIADYNVLKLLDLIDRFDNLTVSAFDKLIEVLTSDIISNLPEDQKKKLWEHLTRFTYNHRRFSEAKWALSDELLIRIEKISEKLVPKDPINLYQYLFTDREYDLYEKNGDWKEQQKLIQSKREYAINEIYLQNGIESVIRFAETVNSPGQVGNALAILPYLTIDQTLLPNYLETDNNKHKLFISSYIWRKYFINGINWCDNLDKSSWSQNQIGQFLSYLPFTKNIWNRASEWLKDNQREYWYRTTANPYQSEGDLNIAIDKLLIHDRPHSAISCLNKMLQNKEQICIDKCIQVLFAALNSREPSYVIDEYNIVELIKFLQSDSTVNRDVLFQIEWAYLPLLEHNKGASPKCLERKLSSDPVFFCEVIRLIYRSKKEKHKSNEQTERSIKIASNAWILLHNWETPPGLRDDGLFINEDFLDWLKEVEDISIKSGHLDVALIHIGEVLIHIPADYDGLWINKTVAMALNRSNAEKMRIGFITGMLNSRGVHYVDPTGKPEKDFADIFQHKAEDIENAGFHRFATALREIAETYIKEAKLIETNSKNSE